MVKNTAKFRWQLHQESCCWWWGWWRARSRTTASCRPSTRCAATRGWAPPASPSPTAASPARRPRSSRTPTTGSSSKYTIRSIVCEASCHPVIRPIWSSIQSSHLVICSSGHLVIWSFGYLVIWSFGHLVTRLLCHSVTWSFGHLDILSSFSTLTRTD